MGLSVVIPVGPGDEAWRSLIPDLRALSEEDEIVLASPHCLKYDLLQLAEENGIRCPCFWAPTQPGRARQLNTGFRWATKEILWFLHCDSKLSPDSIEKLRASIARFPHSIHYFDLRFLNDGPRRMIANDFGVWLRSHVFGLPFGDQGLSLHWEIFQRLGGFCEKAEIGEDHLLVWRAHQQRIKLAPVGARLYTSARRYQARGWTITTVRHLLITARQAAPELARLIKMRVSL